MDCKMILTKKKKKRRMRNCQIYKDKSFCKYIIGDNFQVRKGAPSTNLKRVNLFLSSNHYLTISSTDIHARAIPLSFII